MSLRALAGVCLLLAGCASGPDGAARLKAGNEAFDRWEAGGTARDLENAIEQYKQVSGEQQAFALKYLGDAYRELRRLPEAEAAYRKALAGATAYSEVLPFMESKGRSMIESMPAPTQARMFELLMKFAGGSTFNVTIASARF